MFKRTVAEAVENYSQLFRSVPDKYITREMCERIVECHPDTLFSVPERYKTLEMCERVVKEKPHILQYNFD